MNRKSLIFLAVIAVLAASGPLFLVQFPPATDLPQHLAQVRLLHEQLSNGSDTYKIQWWGPNNLIYLMIATPWLIVPPAMMARIALFVIIFSWMSAMALAASEKNRLAEAVVIALPLVFNQAFYWGFLNFLIGFPVFILWFLLTTSNREYRYEKQVICYFVISVLLYASHALWFAVGLAWFFFYSVFVRTTIKKLAVKLLGTIPVIVLSFLWYPNLSSARAEAGFDVAPHWLTTVFARLNPVWIVDSALGGLVGLVEPLMFIIIVAWLTIAIIHHRDRLKICIDRDLALAAAFFFIIALLAPDKYMNTIYFSSRWIPCGLIFLILSMPVPRVRKDYRRGFALILFVAFCALTALRWNAFEKNELSGFRESVNEIPYSSRVLGLDFIKESDFIKGRPFLQMTAYAQVLKGGELAFSFAEHSSGIIAYRKKRTISWTPGLEWFPERVRRSDFCHFDFILVNGREDVHGNFSSISELEPIRSSGRWRIYRVNKK